MLNGSDIGLRFYVGPFLIMYSGTYVRIFMLITLIILYFQNF